MSQAKESTQTLFNVCSLATNVLSERHEGSLIEYTKVTRNVLLATVEDRLTHLDVTSDFLKVATNIYAGYYLMSVALMNSIGNCNVRQVLDRLNTNRDPLGNAKNTVEEWASLEQYLDYPRFKDERREIDSPYTRHMNRTKLSVESNLVDLVKNKLAGKDVPEGQVHTASANDAIKTIYDAPNLAQGKVFEVTIENQGRRAVIPASVVINPLVCNREMFLSMYSAGSQNNSMINRFRRWKDGELSTIADMIFCNDIISERARLLKQDKHGLAKELQRRRSANRLSTLITQKTSIATASTISVISKQTAQDIELAVGGKLSNTKVRDGVFAASGLVMLCIVDEMYEMLTIYYRSLAHPQELTFAEVKSPSKGNGPNPMEILKAFQSGQVPNI